MQVKNVLFISFLGLLACNQNKDSGSTRLASKLPEEVVVVDSFVEVYGLRVNKFTQMHDTGEVPRNSLFNQLFDGYQVDKKSLQKAIRSTEQIFSFRNMKSGIRYNLIYHMTDSGKKADYFVYHHQADRKLVVNLRDSVFAYWHQLPIDTLERSLYANIDRTLYHSIVDANVSYDLGIMLSEVFAWQVDFFKIDEKDFVKVIFDEYRVEGESSSIGRIKAAEFYHRGDTFFAFNFVQDSAHNYFDDKGNSLRKTFLRAPLKYSRISSRYTKRRFHPVQRRWKAHLGTDYAAPTGTPIRTVGDGVVIASGYGRGNGNFVKIKHNATYTTQYLHMSRIARTSKVGRRVKQGDVIGYVGSTGLATGPHLCFRFWKNGVQVDPFTIKVLPSTPIHDHMRVEFEKYKVYYLDRLNGLALQGQDGVT